MTKTRKSYAFILKVKPGCEAEYKKRHDEISQEMRDFLTEVGYQNYHIFLHKNDLIGYFECDDFERLKRLSSESDINRRWGEYMAPIMDIEIDPDTDFPFLLEEVFSHN